MLTFFSDGNIRYFEFVQDRFELLSEYKSGDPQRGLAFLPKRGVNTHENEVMRAFKTVNDSYIERISFIVPRRAEVFQDDICKFCVPATRIPLLTVKQSPQHSASSPPCPLLNGLTAWKASPQRSISPASTPAKSLQRSPQTTNPPQKPLPQISLHPQRKPPNQNRQYQIHLP